MRYPNFTVTPMDVYGEFHTQKHYEESISRSGWRLVDFRPPTIGEDFVVDQHTFAILRYTSITPTTSPRLIVEKIRFEQFPKGWWSE